MLLVNPKSRDLDGWKNHKLNSSDWNNFLGKIGVVTDKKRLVIKHDEETFEIEINPTLEVHSLRPAFRVGRNDTIIEQVIITLTQSHRIKSGKYAGVKFRSGCTMVLSILNDIIKLDYIIVKRFDSNRRLFNQVQYQLGFESSMAMPVSSYDDSVGSLSINFEKLHLH
jgi:hypothetical protein